MTEDFEGQSCGTCRHSYFAKGADHLQCRANCPQVIVQLAIVQQPSLDEHGIAVMAHQIQNRVGPMYPPIQASDPGCHQYERSEYSILR